MDEKSTGVPDQLVAHTPNESGEWHGLRNHLQDVAANARAFAKKFSAGDLAHLMGLLHDAGKAHSAFQEYLQECAAEPERKHRGPDHKGAGALLAANCKQELLVFPIAGHHGGIQNKAELKTWLREKIAMSQTQEAVTAFRALASCDDPCPDVKPPDFVAKSNDPFVNDLFVRMLFSALVDADFLDTEGHFEYEKHAVRGAVHEMSELWACFEEDQECLPSSANPDLQRIRDEIFKSCVDAASLEPGFFRLTVPTGGGKTRSSLAFALNHAIQKEKSRVIVAIPYTSIIEQTADVYRGIFDKLDNRIVLEHHSAVDADEDDDAGKGASWARLAAENWDAPLVVTTTVQLFESLFSNKTSRCRKLHNIVNSVIILDEVQTLPTHLLSPILDVLRQLVSFYGVSVVFCTATQPALDDSPYLKGIEGVREIAPDPQRLFKGLKRVDYEPVASVEAWDWNRVAAVMCKEAQALVVVNTRKDAVSLLDALEDDKAVHLSTLLCGAHRSDVLKQVRESLNSGKPCRLVATQVVEAGVDIDFPLVLRAIGPLDRIVQAAGRCNREGKLPNGGRMIVFDPSEGSVPRGDYRSGTDTARGLMGIEGFDFHDPAIYTTYFKKLYQVVDTDVPKIQELRKAYRFKDVADSFQMIKDVSMPVVVRYRGIDGTERVVDEILSAIKYLPPRTALRRLQPYIVNVRAYALRQYQSEGLVRELLPGLWEWIGVYHLVKGLIAAAIDPEFLTVAG